MHEVGLFCLQPSKWMGTHDKSCKGHNKSNYQKVQSALKIDYVSKVQLLQNTSEIVC